MTVRFVPLDEPEPLSNPRLSNALRHDWFVWDEFTGGQRRVDLHPLLFSRASWEDAHAAAKDTVRLAGRAARRAFDSNEEAARYGFSPRVLELARASHAAGDDEILSRVDLLLGDDGRFHACEVNADCPGGHNETVALPLLAARAGFTGGETSPSLLKDLADRLVALSGGPGSPLGVVALVFATAYAEDLQVCALIERALVAAGGRALRIPPTALRVEGGALHAKDERVSVLYRFFPTEHFAELALADDVAKVVRNGKVRSLSSFASMPLQSKLSFARVHATKGELSLEDRAIVDARIAFTCLPSEAEGLATAKDDWVLKRALGRVGDEVFVGRLFPANEWTSIVEAVTKAVAGGDVWIAQRYVPQRTVSTPGGERYLTLGIYVMGDKTLGAFARLTPSSHASHDALVVPAFLERGAA